jgi:hypothetical protein
MATFDWSYDKIGNWICGFDFEETPKPVQVIYNPPHTIVVFKDGSKAVVKCQGENFDYEKGFAMALAKKIMGRCEFERLMERGKAAYANKVKKLEKAIVA